MSNYITLLGAEKVREAATVMQDAAESMRNSVGQLDDVLFRHRTLLEELLQRFEAAVASTKEKS